MRPAWDALVARAGARRLAGRFGLIALVAAAVGAVVGAAGRGAVANEAAGPAAPALALASPRSVPRFIDMTNAAGLDVVQRVHGCSGNVAGAAVADFNGDGRLDVYLPESGGPGRLALGTGGGRFRLTSPQAHGIPTVPSATGAVAADYDNDGRPDLYIVARGHNVLLHNEGGGRFRDVTDSSGTGDAGPGTTAAWGDYNGDGRLDLYVVNGDNCRDPQPEPDRLYENLGGGRFRDVSKLLVRDGATTDGVGLQASWADIDHDGRIDLYLANDDLGFRPNVFWRNDGRTRRGWRFTPISAGAVAMSSMGIGVGGLDGSGRLDLVVSDLHAPPLALLRTRRGFTLRRFPNAAGDPQPIGWGAVVADFNNDAAPDVLVAGGDLGLDPARQRSLLYLGDGHGGFREAGVAAGLGAPGRGRGVAVADFNNDGLLDVLITRLGQSPRLLINAGMAGAPPAHWLELRLRGTTAPRDPCGATVAARVGPGRSVIQQLSCGSEGLASGDHLIHLGLGSVTRTDVRIDWPDGRSERLHDVAADRVLSVREPR